MGDFFARMEKKNEKKGATAITATAPQWKKLDLENVISILYLCFCFILSTSLSYSSFFLIDSSMT